jgi:thymidylate synthase ThyX
MRAKSAYAEIICNISKAVFNFLHPSFASTGVRMVSELIGKRINVLNLGFIELQDVMGDDLAIVNAARVSFLGESKGAEKDKKLLFYLLRNHHTSPFEMVEFKFRVKAPLVTW